MNTDYIRSLLIMFNNRNVYEIETALLIYEFMDKDMKNVTDTEINKVYKLVKSQDELVDDYIKEQVKEIEQEQENEKEKNEVQEDEIEK